MTGQPADGLVPAGPAPAPRALLPGLTAFALLLFALFHLGTWQQYLDGQVRGDAVQTFDMMLSRFVAGEAHLEHPRTGNHFFTNHVMLWLYPAAVLYWIRDDLFMYLAPLNLALALSVVPLGLLVWRKTESMALVWAVTVFFGVNTLTASLRQSVHPESLLIAPWLGLFLAVEARRHWWAIACAAAILMVKEDQPLWLLVYTVWALLFGRGERRTILAVGALGGVALVVFGLLQAMLPRPGGDVEVGFFWIEERYGGVADSPWGLAWWFLTNPQVVLDRMILNPMWLYVAFCGAFVCLYGWRPLLLLVPPAVLLFSAEAEIFARLYYYYAYPLYPPLLYALSEGIGSILRRTPAEWVPRANWLLVGWLAIFGVVHLWMPTRVEGWRQWPPALTLAERARLDAARELVQDTVPRDRPELRAATHYDLGAFVPRGRQVLFLAEEELEHADLVLLDARRRSLDVSMEEYTRLLDHLLRPGSGWRVTREIDGIMALEREEAAPDGE